MQAHVAQLWRISRSCTAILALQGSWAMSSSPCDAGKIACMLHFLVLCLSVLRGSTSTKALLSNAGQSAHPCKQITTANSVQSCAGQVVCVSRALVRSPAPRGWCIQQVNRNTGRENGLRSARPTWSMNTAGNGTLRSVCPGSISRAVCSCRPPPSSHSATSMLRSPANPGKPVLCLIALKKGVEA